MRERATRCEARFTAERVRSLRGRWRTASLAAGWPFPSDWACTSVEPVCETVIQGGDISTRLGELGGDRARAGVGLDGTLQDLAAMHAVSSGAGESDGLVSADPDAVPAWMMRATASGWADSTAAQATARETEDALTGLATATYLRTRLHETYRDAAARGQEFGERYALLTVSVDVPEDASGWNRSMAMVLTADVLRCVFAAGETTALLRPATAAVLTRRDEHLAARGERVRRGVEARLARDPSLDLVEAVRVAEVPMPSSHSRACEVLALLG